MLFAEVRRMLATILGCSVGVGLSLIIWTAIRKSDLFVGCFSF